MSERDELGGRTEGNEKGWTWMGTGREEGTGKEEGRKVEGLTNVAISIVIGRFCLKGGPGWLTFRGII